MAQAGVEGSKGIIGMLAGGLEDAPGPACRRHGGPAAACSGMLLVSAQRDVGVAMPAGTGQRLGVGGQNNSLLGSRWLSRSRSLTASRAAARMPSGSSRATAIAVRASASAMALAPASAAGWRAAASLCSAAVSH